MTTKLSDLHALSNFELRKVIAELNGWNFYKTFGGKVNASRFNYVDIPRADPGYNGIIMWQDVPDWPESIEAAFSLIEDLLDKNYSFSLLDLSSVPDRYMMHVRQRGSARILHYATAPTAARAICEAYVMTMQGEEKNE